MTDAERDELIEKSLLQTLDSAGEARVQQLRRDDAAFNQAYTFQETLIQQVRLKRRQELLTVFAGFEAEQDTQSDSDAVTPVIPLPVAPGQTIIPTNPTVIPLWRQAGFRVAATVALAVIVGAIVWWQLASYNPKPIAHDSRDSLKTQLPIDSPSRKPVPSPALPVPVPQGPVAQDTPRPARLQGPRQVPYYETDNISLGFGRDTPVREYRTVVFSVSPVPAYEFTDTLTVYLPTLPAAKPAGSLVYSRATDTYYLITGQTRYEIVKGLQGRQPLKIVK